MQRCLKSVLHPTLCRKTKTERNGSNASSCRSTAQIVNRLWVRRWRFSRLEINQNNAPQRKQNESVGYRRSFVRHHRPNDESVVVLSLTFNDTPCSQRERESNSFLSSHVAQGLGDGGVVIYMKGLVNLGRKNQDPFLRQIQLVLHY
ncbi:hypothetical protein GWI33_018589 [Rhynchophorus ferrugineus]|uniref:Uncharacterized protein n=1 Tax=Rhynchophorus ferrugineus TaxID=354439 RepID=A0A834HZY2_RHYFE|nr:hypothetical protein GWI33_018589 [Rhynchophorus ferrugineus]